MDAQCLVCDQEQVEEQVEEEEEDDPSSLSANSSGRMRAIQGRKKSGAADQDLDDEAEELVE